jgi:DNA-3-methyladenine glycosylase II
MARRPPKLELQKRETTSSRILSEDELGRAIQQLEIRDPAPISLMLETCGPPPLHRRPGGLVGLAWIIVSQQVSAASAAAIHARIQNRFPDLQASTVLDASDDELRACGLSSPKVRTLRALASAIVQGSLDLDGLENLDPQAAREALTRVKGIGPWSADVYLLFCVGHPDVWPAGDLALQEAARLALGLRSWPDAKRMEKIGERWRPWRAAAARLLWAYYGARPKGGA